MKGPQRRPHKPLEGLIYDPKVLHDLKNGAGWLDRGLPPEFVANPDPTTTECDQAFKIIVAEAPYVTRVPEPDHDHEVHQVAALYAYRRGQRDRINYLIEHHLLGGNALALALSLQKAHQQREDGLNKRHREESERRTKWWNGEFPILARRPS